MRKGRRRIAVILVMSIVMSVLSFGVSCEGAESEIGDGTVFTSGDWSYELLEDGSASVTGYTGSEVNLVIPAEVDGHRVVCIGEGAFLDNKKLEAVKFPDTLQRIGSEAFRACTGIRGDLTIPDSVTEIGESAFWCCHIDGELVLPKNLKQIETSTFFNCRFTGDLNIPKGVQWIGDSAFYENRFTGELIIPENVEKIEQNAFYHNRFTGDLVLPPSVKQIGSRAFTGNEFRGNLTLPEGITIIGKEAFAKCDFTGDLTIPNSVTEIEYSAFNGCDFTGSLVLPGSIKRIGESAFYGCDFKRLEISEGIEEIGDNAFYDNAFAGDLILPSSIKKIGEYAFKDCYYFNGKLILSEGITNIRYGAFQGCGFTGRLTIPHSVAKIEEYAFYSTEGISEIVIPRETTRIGKTAFGNVPATIYGYKGSEAETYANTQGMPFVDLDTGELPSSKPSMTPSPEPSVTPPEMPSPEPLETLKPEPTEKPVVLPTVSQEPPVTPPETPDPEPSIAPPVISGPEPTEEPFVLPTVSQEPSVTTPVILDLAPLPSGDTPLISLPAQISDGAGTHTRQLKIMEVKSVPDDFPHIKWERNPYATGYEIFRSKKKDSGYQKIQSLSSSRTGFMDRKTERGKVYYYKVRAVNEKAIPVLTGEYSSALRLRRQYLNMPVIKIKRINKGGRIAYLKLTVRKSEGKKIQIYFGKGKKKKIVRLRSKKIKRIYRLQYKSSAKHMTFYIRTYSKKGKRFRYSRFAVIKI